MNFDFSYVDLALINGNVITVNAKDDIEEAVGIKDNKIVFVGKTRDLISLTDDDTEVIDLEGKTLMPGIIDSHCHPILAGLINPNPSSGIIDTFYENCKSLDEMLTLIKEAVKLKKPGEWISMMGYEPLLFPEKRHPTIEELNEIAPENPVHCMHCGGHICMYNSKALEYLDVFTAEDASKYPKDEVEVINGKLTGMVRGHTHFWLWGQIEYPLEKQKKAALKSQSHALKNGITSIHDCGEFGKFSYHIMQQMCRNGEFKIRTYMMIHSIFGKPISKSENENFINLGLMSGLGDEHFKIGGSKFMIDGGSGAPSCATREPYSHDPNLPRERGWEESEVADYIKYINEADCQATAHAIGDLAVLYMVEGYEKTIVENPKTHLRHRIEHCSLVDQDLVDRIAKCKVIPTVNSGMLTTIGKNYTKFYGDRMKYMIALKSMLEAGIPASIASDYPSGPMGIDTIDGAVNRFDRVSNFQVDQNQCISVLAAIRCATYNGAFASFEEDIKGSIEVGKLADMIVLSNNILSVPKENICEIKVEKTIIDGKTVYDIFDN